MSAARRRARATWDPATRAAYQMLPGDRVDQLAGRFGSAAEPVANAGNEPIRSTAGSSSKGARPLRSGEEAIAMLNQILPTNEGTADRVVRVVVGLGLLSLTVVGPQSLLGLVGIVPLFTGLVGSCPAYRLLGIATCPMKAAEER